MRILIVAENYFPAKLAGGPVQSLSNLSDWLGFEFALWFYTRDRENRSKKPFAGIEPRKWKAVGNAMVWYSPPMRLFIDLLVVGRRCSPDLVYLNSLLAPMTGLWLFGRILGLVPGCPVLLAPRGELGAGALSIRGRKKKLFLRLLKWGGLLRGVYFHATSREEETDIAREIGSECAIRVAANFSRRQAPRVSITRLPKRCGHVELVFCSRLVAKKNLEFLLQVLTCVSGSVRLRIIGPEEDKAYVRYLRELAKKLPEMIKVDWIGFVAQDSIHETLCKSHFFVLPTLNENYGHVIVEAWQSELPVLISDQTPWHALTQQGSGWDIPLVPAEWIAVLQTCVDMDETSYRFWRDGARLAAAQIADNQPSKEWKRLFDWATIENRSV